MSKVKKNQGVKGRANLETPDTIGARLVRSVMETLRLCEVMLGNLIFHDAVRVIVDWRDLEAQVSGLKTTLELYVHSLKSCLGADDGRQ
jgi:hypothetical protein